jgi:hypothetical protein
MAGQIKVLRIMVLAEVVVLAALVATELLLLVVAAALEPHRLSPVLLSLMLLAVLAPLTTLA